MQTMLRMYCLQQWYNLSDPGVAEALYDMESMRRFAQIELIDDAIPAETTILNSPQAHTKASTQRQDTCCGE